MELNKLPRLACLAITGAMKMTLIAAIEVLLGLLPLHVIIEVDALAGICRLSVINSTDLNPLTMAILKSLSIWSENPSY
jgi:hypothetical protein